MRLPAFFLLWVLLGLSVIQGRIILPCAADTETDRRLELPRAGVYAIPGGGTLETDLPLGLSLATGRDGVTIWELPDFHLKANHARWLNGRWTLIGTAEVDGISLANVRDLERIDRGEFAGALFLASMTDTGEVEGLGLDQDSALAFLPDKRIFILDGHSNITSMREDFHGTLDTNGSSFLLDNGLEIDGRLSFRDGKPYLRAGYTLSVAGVSFSRPARDLDLVFRLEDTAEAASLTPDSLTFFRDGRIGVRAAGLHIAVPGIDIGNQAEIIALPSFRDSENTLPNDARLLISPPLNLKTTLIRKGSRGDDAARVREWLDAWVREGSNEAHPGWPVAPGTGEVFDDACAAALKAVQEALVASGQLSGRGKEKADGTFGLRTNRAISLRMISGRIELLVSELVFEDGSLHDALPIDFLTIPYQEEDRVSLDIRAVVDRIEFPARSDGEGQVSATLLPGIVIPDSGDTPGRIDCGDLLRWLRRTGSLDTAQVQLLDRAIKQRWGLGLKMAELEKDAANGLQDTLLAWRAAADKAFEATRLEGETPSQPISRPTQPPPAKENVAAEELYARNRQINTRRRGFASEYNRPVDLGWIQRKFPEWERKVSFQLSAEQIRRNNPHFFDPPPDLKRKGVHVAESARTKTTKYYTPLYGRGEKIEWYKVRTMEGTAIIQQGDGTFKVYDIYKGQIPMTEKNMGGATAAYPLVTFRSVAVNTKKIKPGTWLYVEFFPPRGMSRSPYTGWYEACDHGGAMAQSWRRGVIHVDIFSGVGRNNYLTADRSVPQRARRIVYYDDGQRHHE